MDTEKFRVEPIDSLQKPPPSVGAIIGIIQGDCTQGGQFWAIAWYCGHRIDPVAEIFPECFRSGGTGETASDPDYRNWFSISYHRFI
jgi:hypothetical protein